MVFAATEFRLKNGIPVVYQHIPEVKVVSVQIWMKTGSVNETAKTSGISHFLEHMVFKGTELFGPDEIDQIVEASGGSMNAGTSKDYTNYYVTLPAYNAEIAYTVLSEMVFSARFIPEEIEKEKPVVVQEIRRKFDNPTHDMWQTATEILMKGTPYAREIIGTEETVNSFTREMLMDYYNRYYHPANMTLVVVGDISSAEAMELAERYFDRTKPAKAGKKYAGKALPPLTKQKPLQIAKGVNQEYGFIGFRAPSLLSDDRYVFEVMTEILAGGELSLLNNELKNKQMLVNSVNAGYLGHKFNGAFLVLYGAEPGKGDAIRAETMKLLKSLGSGAVNPDDVEKAKNRLKSQIVFQREKVSAEANDIGYAYTIGVKEYYTSFIEKVSKVTPDDVRKLASNLFSQKDLFIRTVPEAPAAK